MSDAYLGEIRLFSNNYAPNGWRLCDGSLVNINDYQALFSLIGVMYGGDGRTTFGLPNLQGCVALGQGTATSGTIFTMATSGGSEVVTLTEANFPAHNHTLSVSDQLANSQTPSPILTLGALASNLHLYTDTSQGVNGTKDFSANAITYSGASGGSHDNMMPYITFGYMICTDGFYPSFS
jgi:microcystin-dependent protein